MSNAEMINELIETLSDRKLILQKIEECDDEFIENVISVLSVSKMKTDITSLYQAYKAYKESNSSNGLSATDEVFYKMNLSNIELQIATIIGQINLSSIIENIPISDELMSNVVKDLIQDFLIYDRKDDEEINVKRMAKHFKDNPNAIDFVVQSFKESLTEKLSNPY